MFENHLSKITVSKSWEWHVQVLLGEYLLDIRKAGWARLSGIGINPMPAASHQLMSDGKRRL